MWYRPCGETLGLDLTVRWDFPRVRLRRLSDDLPERDLVALVEARANHALDRTSRALWSSWAAIQFSLPVLTLVLASASRAAWSIGRAAFAADVASWVVFVVVVASASAAPSAAA